MCTSAIVLAGGASSRFGRDKRYLEVDGETLLSRTVRVVRTEVQEVVVVGSQVPVRREGVRFIPDGFPGSGPLGGILTGLEQTRGQWVFIAACDMPLLRPQTVRFLLALAAQADADAIVPLAGGRSHPLHAVYRSSVAAAWRPRLQATERSQLSLRSALSDIRVRWVTGAELRSVDPRLESLVNVNTEVEWQGLLGAERQAL
ncbi:MAG TPA: molybdenum cofactor guanylyltransferase [Chloroflexota bacterium]|nr:molybdenum cofactor guanylyltransferase [Chloroflexota bacterium]